MINFLYYYLVITKIYKYATQLTMHYILNNKGKNFQIINDFNNLQVDIDCWKENLMLQLNEYPIQLLI